MYRPPAVRYQVVPSRWHAATVLVLCGLGPLAAAHFFFQASSWETRCVGLLAWIFVILWAAWDLFHAHRGSLWWDGAQWHWSAWDESPVAELQVLMDLQWALVLRVRSESGHALRIWLDQRPGQTSWRAMRRALMACQHS